MVTTQSMALGHGLLDSLASVRWDTALRTFGNNHATLIGLLVDWWVSSDPSRWALEGGPAFCYTPRGQGGGGQCDAVFCESNAAAGILEVEGTRSKWTVEKLGHFFARTPSTYEEFQTLQFAILLLYGYYPTGRGSQRAIGPVRTDEVTSWLIDLSNEHPSKPVVLLTLDKVYERPTAGARSRNEYYWGRPARVEGVLFEGGVTTGSRVYREAPTG